MPGDPGGAGDEDRPDDVLPVDAPGWLPSPPTDCPECGTAPDDVPDVLYDPLFSDTVQDYTLDEDQQDTPIAFTGFRCRPCGARIDWTADEVDGTPICGIPTKTTGDPCQHRVSAAGSCRSHGDVDARLKALTDGEYSIPLGSGEAPSTHTDGSGRPPEGNKNAVTHGVHAYESDPWGLLDYFEAERPRIYRRICGYFWDYMKDAPFPAYILQDGAGVPDGVQDALEAAFDPASDIDVPGVDVPRLTAKADRLMLVCIGQGVTWASSMEQGEDGLTKTEKRISESGGEYYVELERPVNLPKNRMRKQDLRELKELGILDDPDSALANEIAGWGEAAKRVAEREDGAVDGRRETADQN